MQSVGWVILVVLGVAAVAVLSALLTDGRYFGKGLMLWVYDRVGPLMFGSRSEAEQWRMLVEKLRLRGDERILDVGTAIGDLPLTLASADRFRGHAVGVDWSRRMVVAASEAAMRRGLLGRVGFLVADLREGLPFGDGGFDVVFCLGLLETLASPERALGELNRALAPDGTMVVSLYRRGWSSSVEALSLTWYKGHLRALGLGGVTVAPCRRSQDVVIARAPASRSRAIPRSQWTEELEGDDGQEA